MITSVSPANLRLTDPQFVALSRAAQSADRRVQAPPNVCGAAASRFFGGLMQRGLIDKIERDEAGSPG